MTSHPCVLMASMRGLYLSILVSMAGVVYLSCVNVNFIIWMVRRGVGMHLVVRHEHGSRHGMISCDWLSILPKFLNVWCLV